MALTQDDPEYIEGDDEEVLITSEEGASGEALLCREYLLASDDGREEEEGGREGKGGMDKPTDANLLDAPYVRPVTPQMFSHRPQTANLPGTPVFTQCL